MLSFGMEYDRAFSIAFCSARFEPGSGPPSFAATMIARVSFEKSLPRFASAAPFLCLIVDHLLCPDTQFPFTIGVRRRARILAASAHPGVDPTCQYDDEARDRPDSPGPDEAHEEIAPAARPGEGGGGQTRCALRRLAGREERTRTEVAARRERRVRRRPRLRVRRERCTQHVGCFSCTAASREVGVDHL